MLIIWSVISFLILNSNCASIVPNLDFSENELDQDLDDHDVGNDIETNQVSLFPTIDPTIDEDARLNVPQLIMKYGYKVEVHFVTTEDGYILQLHRISGGEKSPPRKGKKVVYWMHGLMDSSAGVILSGPHHALGYLLVDNDYDVWLGNARGSFYSTNHTTLNPFGSLEERKRYWSFSWNEIGVYDLPACIDYILAETDEKKLQYVGHSQGGTVFFVMCSERPDYNDKIEMMHGLAPAAYLSHAKSPPIRAIVPLLPVVQTARELIGLNYIIVNKELRVAAGELLCRDKVPTQAICENMLFLIMGYESDQMNSTLLPVLFGHAPAGAATNQLLHYGQCVQSGCFRQYDYGPLENRLKYEQSTPPNYNLENVHAPVAIYHSQNDWLATMEDTRILVQKLPNVFKEYLVPHKKFNHIDFILGIDAPTLLFDEILKTMNYEI